MEVEHEVKVIPINDRLSAEIEKLGKEGWTLLPGAQPVAIYHVMRPKQKTQSEHVGRGTMLIDDSKIGIIRDGKLIQ